MILLLYRRKSCKTKKNKIKSGDYRIPRCTTSHTHGAVFPSSLQEGANAERYVFGKLSERRSQRRPFAHRHYSNCRDIEHGESAQRGVMHTIVQHRLHQAACNIARAGGVGGVSEIAMLLVRTRATSARDGGTHTACCMQPLPTQPGGKGAFSPKYLYW